jgi:hypothetical protein
MTALAVLLDSHPERRSGDNRLLADTIETLLDCAQICSACADACLAEPAAADLTECVRRNLDCADMCTATARILSRSGTPVDARPEGIGIYALLDACAQVCRSCADECADHAEHHEHCRICAQACRLAEQACWDFLTTAYATPEGVPAAELADGDLIRELAQLHRTRHDTFLHGAESAVLHHTSRMTELEAEYLARHPDRPVDARRTRAGARASS